MASEKYEFFDLHQDNGVAVLRMQVRELRHPQAAQQFGAEVRTALQSSGQKNVVVDMQPVEYVGSTAFATLLNLAKQINADGGKLKICDLHPDVSVGANILGLGKAIEIFDDRRSAVQSFASA